jgi:hypothetical protein
MSKIKMTVIMLFATISFSAIPAIPASAEWFISGTKLAAGTTIGLATTAKVDTGSVTSIVFGGGAIKASCEVDFLGHAESPEIVTPNEVRAKSLIFEGCKIIEPATKCVLTSSTIQTEPVRAVITQISKASEDRVTLTPQTRSAFADVPFASTNTCVFNEEEPIQGAITLAMPTGKTESSTQAIEGLGSVENNSLQVAGDKMYVEGGRALVKLQSGSKWSFR